MEGSNLRSIILKLESRLSDNDRKRLHFFLGNDVPRRIRDDPSLTGTLNLMESLFDQDKINEQDFTLLINAFNQIQCFDAVKLLNEYRRQMQINGHNQLSQNILSKIFQDQETDKLATWTQLPFINQTTTTDTVSLNCQLKSRFQIMILLILFISIIGLTLSTSIFILKFQKEKQMNSNEELQKTTLTETIKQLNEQLEIYKRDEEKLSVRYGSRIGGSGGGPFDDSHDLQLRSNARLKSIEFYSRSQLVAIRFVYENENSSVSSECHGSDRYPNHDYTPIRNQTFSLLDDEQITKVFLYSGKGNGTHQFKVINTPIVHIMGIQFLTNKDRLTDLFGTDDGTKSNESYEGFSIGYATGRSGDIIDMLQFVWYRQRRTHNDPPCGGEGGKPFDDSNDLQLSSTARLIAIQSFWRNKLVALKFMYQQDQTNILNSSHGFYNDPEGLTDEYFNSTFFLAQNEQIIKVTLYVGNGTGEDIGRNSTYRYVMGIQFHTNQQQTTIVYGSTTDEQCNQTATNQTLAYATGRSGGLIDMLQFVWFDQNSSDDPNDKYWIEVRSGTIPQSSFIGGYQDQKDVYIARVYSGLCCVFLGKLIKGNQQAEYPFIHVQTSSIYQILIYRNSPNDFQWIDINDFQIPSTALPAGHEDQHHLYIARFNDSNLSFIGQYNATDQFVYYTYQQNIYKINSSFQLLCTS